MLKFLRKYKSWILVVGGSLLMIAFLLPGNISRLPLARGAGTFMTIDGHKISQVDAMKASHERTVIHEVAPGMLEALGISSETDHWILLCREAERLGLVGGPDDGRDYLPDLAAELATASKGRPLNRNDPADADRLTRARELLDRNILSTEGHLRMPEREVHQALAKFRGIVRMVGMYSSTGELVSTPRVDQEAKRRLDQAIIDYVFLPASNYTFNLPEPSADEIQAHFEKYKDVDPGQGEYGLGYRFGPRFQLEWITLNRSVVDSMIKVSPVDVRKAFMQEYPGGTEEQFQAAKADIEARLHTAAVDKVMDDESATVKAEIAKAMRKVESSGQYRDLPPDWMAQRPSYETISGAVVARLIEAHGLTIPSPVVSRRQDEWLTQSALMQLPGIGTANVRHANRSGTFTQYVSSLKELAGPNDIGLQVGVPGEPVTDRQGNVYFFTITAFKPAGPAENVSEVRARVIDGLQRITAFEQLKADAEGYRQQAVAGGLLPLTHPPAGAPSNTPLGTIRSDVGVGRTDQLYPMDQVLNTEATRAAIVDAASKLDPKVDPATIDVSQRTIALPIPEKLGLAVIILKGYNPTTLEAVRLRDFSVARVIGGTELREAALADAAAGTRREDPFSLEALARRHNATLSTEHKTAQERREKDEAERAAAAVPGRPVPKPVRAPGR
jgi:hypothetical protein